MMIQPIDFPRLLRLWPLDEKNTAYAELAKDMGVPPNRARQWLKRSYMPPWYWPRFRCVLQEKFSLEITNEQLVQASQCHGDLVSARARRSAETRKRNQRRNKEVDNGSDSPRL